VPNILITKMGNPTGHPDEFIEAGGAKAHASLASSERNIIYHLPLNDRAASRHASKQLSGTT